MERRWVGGGRAGVGEVGSFILRPCPKHRHLQCFRLFVPRAEQRMRNNTRASSVHAFRDHAQNTGIHSAFVSLYSILHKDVEQGKQSQASMPLTTMPKTLLSIPFLFLYVVAGCGLG